VTAWLFDTSFRIEITDDPNAVRADFHGELDAITASVLCRAAPIPTRPGRSTVLDLSELTIVDMSGAREILRIAHEIEREGGTVQFQGVTRELEEMLRLIS